jgi:hypothetical protein
MLVNGAALDAANVPKYQQAAALVKRQSHSIMKWFREIVLGVVEEDQE